MLRRCLRRAYRYQEFEMHGISDMPSQYPREAPNTSVFPQYQDSFWQHWGWGRQELWIECNPRRYLTSWETLRPLILFTPFVFFVWPLGLLRMYMFTCYGDEGVHPFLASESRMPLDNLYVERGGNPLNAEWLRHIHSKESF